MRFRVYAWSLLVAAALTALVAALASLSVWSSIGVLLAPGMIGAALFFPEGINSNGGNGYLVVAGLLNVVLLAFPVMWLWKVIERHWKAKKVRD
jgi:hypothetical protein